MPERDDERQVQSARHDRRVRRGRAVRERDAGDRSRGELELRDLGRAEVARDENHRRVRQPQRRRGRQYPRRPPPDLPHVRRAGGEERIAELGEERRVTLRRTHDRDLGHDLERQRRDLGREGRVFGHQPVRLDDLGLVDETRVAQPRRGGPELARDFGEGLERACLFTLAAGAVRAQLRLAEHERFRRGDASGGSEPTEDALGHCSMTARSSAPKRSAVDVAPGS